MVLRFSSAINYAQWSSKTQLSSKWPNKERTESSSGRFYLRVKSNSLMKLLGTVTKEPDEGNENVYSENNKFNSYF